MKTVLFHPRIEKSFRASYAPLGIMSIATNLNKNGHTAVICDRFFESQSVEQVLNKHNPDVIGISIMAHSFLNDAIHISKIAKMKNIPVIWGGSLATAIDKKILESGLADYVSLNEGEITWVEIAEAFDKNEDFYQIKGLSYIKNGDYISTEEREFIDLTLLPDLDWTLVDPKKYFQKTYGFNRMLNMYYSKGCGGRCSYCYNPGFHHSRRRCRAFETVFREMKMLSEKYGADGFDFTDDLLFANRNEAIKFCEELINQEINVCWSGYLGVGILNSLEDFKLLYKSGCRSIIFGVESGSLNVLKSVNKKVLLDKVKSNVEFCNEAGIVPITMFILGLPGEDEDDIKCTLQLIKSLDGASSGYNFFTPLPGSELFEELIRTHKMEEMADIYDYAKIQETEKLLYNFTKVSSKELITIKKFIRLRGIFAKTNNSVSGQVAKVFLSTASSWLGRGVFHFLKSFIYTVYSFVSLLSVFLHPNIRKKYELYFKK